MIRNPSDLGYDDRAFVLPPIQLNEHTVDVIPAQDWLSICPSRRRAAGAHRRSRDTLVDRVTEAALTVAQDAGAWVAWCNLNAKSDDAGRAEDRCRRGAPRIGRTKRKGAKRLRRWGKHRIIVTKPTIAGFGLNWQHCANVAFVGLSDSWEQYYQAVRRCWRFGQKQPVKVHVITPDMRARYWQYQTQRSRRRKDGKGNA